MQTLTTIKTLLICIAVLLVVGSLSAQDSDYQLGPPPGTYKILYADSTINIPFELYRGDIRMNAQINGQSVRLLLDNGFMWDQMLFWGGPGVDALGFTYEEKVEVGGAGDGNALQSDLASGITVSFPGVEFYDQEAIVTPTSAGIWTMWSGSEGQVCGNFFKNFVVGINFDKMILTLTEPDKFIYSDTGMSVPLIPNGDASFAIPATIVLDDGRTITRNLSLDLGLNDALNLGLGGEYNITVPENHIETSLGFGIQGEILGYKGRIKSLTIGDYTLEDIITGFVKPDPRENAVGETWLGLELFSRFNIVFDYPGRKMYFEPNKAFDKPFEYDMTGMTLRRSRDGDWLTVQKVYEGTPASEAGIDVGDKVITINGEKATSLDVFDRIPLFRQVGRTISFEIEREGKLVEKSITLRRVI